MYLSRIIFRKTGNSVKESNGRIEFGTQMGYGTEEVPVGNNDSVNRGDILQEHTFWGETV
jgi:hypothetical protein